MTKYLSNVIKPLKELLNSLKHYSFEAVTYKIFLDLDLQFYDINLQPFLKEYVYNYEDFYSSKIIGLPTVLNIEKANNDFVKFPTSLDFSKLLNHSQYAVMTFKQTNFSYSTKAILNIRGVELDNIEVYKLSRFKGVKLIAKADKEKLQTIGFID